MQRLKVFTKLFSRYVHKKEISFEEMVEKYPFTVRLLAEKGIRCIACGEPIWGTLEEACLEKGFDQEKIEAIVGEINDKIK